MFVDRVTIEVVAGSGGDGVISFHRAKYVPRGGPDGGDGGDGGSVTLEAADNLNSLDRIARSPRFVARSGEPGRGRNQSGGAGRSLIIPVPLGTMIRDGSGTLLADLTEEGQRFVIAKGGLGGKGNTRFATATRQVPRIATRGEDGGRGHFQLELKLIAQVGLVGLPNAGKSTFLRASTRARPAVGAYPFTTLTPYLGVANVDAVREMTLADIPGLIEGASRGVGLGDEFLRHVERTLVLLHVVDVTSGPDMGTPDPVEAWQTIRRELVAYDAAVGNKRVVTVLNKCDALSAEDAARVREDLEAVTGDSVYLMSGVTGSGVRELLFALADQVEQAQLEQRVEPGDDGAEQAQATEAELGNDHAAGAERPD
jgi:GTPase